MSIENPTLAHFRHFSPKGFSSLFTNLPAYKALYLRAYKAPLHLSRTLYKSTHFMQNKPNFVNPEIGVSSFGISKYGMLTAWRSKKTNPISKKPK
jgi:hypothetical protein